MKNASRNGIVLRCAVALLPFVALFLLTNAFFQKYNISSITPDMNAEQRARLYLHPGFLIWICALILFVAVFLAVKRYRKKPQHRQLRTIRSLS